MQPMLLIGFVQENKQWGTYKANSAGYYTITFPLAFSSLYNLSKTSAYRGSDGAGDERYINWQNNTQARIGCDIGGFSWIAIGA